MNDALAVILGGGRGTRRFPLTRARSKPAVPTAGKYRLIDIPISNCINSELKRIFVLTQYNSESLNNHVGQTYKFDAFTPGFVTILAETHNNNRAQVTVGVIPVPREQTAGFGILKVDSRGRIVHFEEKPGPERL